MKNLKEYCIVENENDVTSEDAKRELLPDDERYCVIQVGGSIGEQSSFNYRLGGQHCRISRDNMTAEEAKEYAKRMRNFLTPGERKYYGITYKAVLFSKLKEI
jgi:hypothetical protein